VVFKLWSTPHQFSRLRGWRNEKIKSKPEHEFKIRFDKGCLKDSLDKTTVIDEEEVNEGECRNNSVEVKAKVEDRTGV